jgi:putative tryptophan/tyrosine transport system substrate-binding protein
MTLRRRDFITLLGGAAAAWPLVARAQQTALSVVGFITGARHEGSEAYIAALRDGLRETGFVEGRNVTIEARFADDHYERLPMLAADLIERRVAVIAADPRGSYAAQAATKTIPIVFMAGADPVRNGLVTRLDRPGGNLTGVTILASDLGAKRFGLFRDLVPQAPLIGVLADATVPQATRAINIPEVEEAASRLRTPIKLISAGTEGEIDVAFATFAREGASAVFFINGFFFFSSRARLNALALRYQMASCGEAREYVDDGGLMSYGPSIPDAYRKVGVYLGRILKGEKAGDLPVQLPTKFEFLINLKIAKALGLTVPPTLLATADEVIE